MKKNLKRLGLILLAIFIIIQFFRPARNINIAPAAFANDITKVYPVPDSVQAILKSSCYDCHSNNTVYPWYANIQPVAWWLNDHIVEGKNELNFSEFASYRIRRKYKKMEEVIDQVKKDEMPLYSYTIIHRYAALSKNQKNSLIDWANEVRDTIKANYPADSLLRKQP
ncbi:MAG: cytochrome [Ferruginibacter sp.]|nr:cytochrome [Ferruginibacter sp.]